MQGVRLKHGTWVLVADSEKALFLKNAGDANYLDLNVVRKVEEENPPTHEQGTDRPGRYSEGPNAHRTAVDDTDWHRLAKERFADEIAERLYELSHRGNFDEIVLVAPPLVLGELRKKLHKEVAEKVAAEVPKTLTSLPVPGIEAIFHQE